MTRSFQLKPIGLTCIFCLLVGLFGSLSDSNPSDEITRAPHIALRPGLSANQRVTADINETNLDQAFVMYAELTGRTRLPWSSNFAENIDSILGGRLTRWGCDPSKTFVQQHPVPRGRPPDDARSQGEPRKIVREERNYCPTQGYKFFRTTRPAKSLLATP